MKPARPSTEFLIVPPGGIDRSPTADVGLPHAIRQANAGDPNAVAVFTEAGHQLARCFLSVVALVHPEQIIPAGPLAAARPFVEAIQRALEAFTGPSQIPVPAFIVSRISYLRATELMGLDALLFAQPVDGRAGRPAAGTGE